MVPPVIPVQSDTGISSRPDDGRPDRIRTGVYITVSSTKTLIQNPQLLWFALLAGLVLIGHLIIQGILAFFSMNYRSDLIGSPVIAFAVELPTVFCLLVLCAGLVLSLSHDDDTPHSFLSGLKKVQKYLVPLALWSVIVAFAGTLLFTAGRIMTSLDNPGTHVLDIYGNLYNILFNVFSQYPFNWSLNPDVLAAYLPGGVFTGFDSGFPNAFIHTLVFSAINVFLIVLTLFVVPLLVLERKRIRDAFFESFTLMKNIRGELSACVLGLGLVVFAASLTVMLFQFTGISTVEITNSITRIPSPHPGEAWIALGLLYSLVLAGFTLIVATIGGIASLDLYRHAKTRVEKP